nr:hypothetical protein Iba_chr06cCG12230 [Ipomoea batatas]
MINSPAAKNAGEYSPLSSSNAHLNQRTSGKAFPLPFSLFPILSDSVGRSRASASFFPCSSGDERQSKSSRGLHLRRTPCGDGSGILRRCKAADNMAALSLPLGSSGARQRHGPVRHLPPFDEEWWCVSLWHDATAAATGRGVAGTFGDILAGQYSPLSSSNAHLNQRTSGKALPLPFSLFPIHSGSVGRSRASASFFPCSSGDERQSKSSRGLHLRRTPCGDGSGILRRCKAADNMAALSLPLGSSGARQRHGPVRHLPPFDEEWWRVSLWHDATAAATGRGVAGTFGDIPALRFTEATRARIEKAMDDCLTFDQQLSELPLARTRYEFEFYF